MLNKAISVTQFNNYIKSIFDAEVMLHSISIFGEITDCQIVRDIAYFSIKDQTATLSCVAFGASKFLPMKNGDQVVLTGSPNFYVKGGRFNFNVSKIEQYGQGLLYLEFLRLKEKLESEGLFDQSTKKPIPQNIKTIGVVTSETGAVIEDIINVATRRNTQINIILYPAKVQGDGAAKTVIEGVKFFDDYEKVDAIVVARGGGSMEDLSVFNNEELARVVFATRKFVLSAIGHETDFTIMDFVADLRAPTPSAAAEILATDMTSILQNINNLKNRLQSGISAVLKNAESQLKLLQTKLQLGFGQTLAKAETVLETRKHKLIASAESFMSQKEYEFAFEQSKLENLNPQTVLKRGWAKIEQKGIGVLGIAEIKSDHMFQITMQDGTISAKKIEEEI